MNYDQECSCGIHPLKSGTQNYPGDFRNVLGQAARRRTSPVKAGRVATLLLWIHHIWSKKILQLENKKKFPQFFQS